MDKDELLQELKHFYNDLKEVTLTADLEYQVKRLGELIERAEATDLKCGGDNIHGGGTGND